MPISPIIKAFLDKVRNTIWTGGHLRDFRKIFSALDCR